MRKIGFKPLVVLLVMALLLALGTVGGCTNVSPGQTQATTTQTTTVTVTAIDENWTAPAASGQSLTLPGIADVVALVKPSVVSINTEVVSYDFFNRAYLADWAGSGWVLDEDGIIVTNYHVIEDASNITVTLDNGSSYTVDTGSIATDPLNDLAILKIDAHDLTALKRGDPSSLRVGDWVVAIGNALGQGIRATEGIISRKGVTLSVDTGETLYDLLETSAAINPGNSGGPLVDLAGEVIGITSAKIAETGVEGMGYAISVDTAMPILEELITRGYVARPWIGVGLYPMSQGVARQLRLSISYGVLITEITEGGPAALVGLEVGDIITSMGDTEVNTVEEFSQVLLASETGQPMEITYWRGNSQATVQVVPEETPPPS